jgi:hypothetical protein
MKIIHVYALMYSVAGALLIAFGIELVRKGEDAWAAPTFAIAVDMLLRAHEYRKKR